MDKKIKFNFAYFKTLLLIVFCIVFLSQNVQAGNLDFDKPQIQQSVKSMGFVSVQHAADSIKTKAVEAKQLQDEVVALQKNDFEYKAYKDVLTRFEQIQKIEPLGDEKNYKVGKGSTNLLMKAYSEYMLNVQALSAELQEIKIKVQEYENKKNAMPSLWPTNSSDISSHFGYRISPGGIGSTNHQGVDISGYHGDPIYATADGIVTLSRWYYGYGYLVEIDHENGLRSRYAHNSKLLVYEGSRVKKGQQIALMGATGNATGTHLHFEIRSNGTPVNPLLYVKAK